MTDTVVDVDTDVLMNVLKHKLKQLNDSGMLLHMYKMRICGKNEALASRCIEPNCNFTLSPRLSRENIEEIRKPVKEVGINKLREVIKAFNVNPEKKKYTIVTGASANHFMESQVAIESLYKNVFPHISNYSFVYYDLGLTEEQRQLVQNYSGAEYKTFPYDKLPARFKYLNCYIWKPLIVLAHLQNTEYFIWMDSSVRFAKDARPYFDMASKTGIIINRNEYQFAQHVYPKMFTYFGDKSACQFSTYGEIEGGFVVLHNEPFSRHLVIEPWGACALDPNCMCPDETKKMLTCDTRIRQYGKCHRYDQATIGYILIKLLRENRESVLIKNHVHAVHKEEHGFYLTDLRDKAIKNATASKG